MSFNILRNKVQAEEIMHDTLLRLFEAENVFPTREDRDKWLTRVCINLSLDQLRKNKKLENIFLLDNMAFYDEDPSQFQEQEQTEVVSLKGITAEDIKNAISQLAPGYRIIMNLFLFEGYDYEEIAQITGLKESSVRSQYVRGKMKALSNLKKHRWIF